jgi:hypothetical protein
MINPLLLSLSLSHTHTYVHTHSAKSAAPMRPWPVIRWSVDDVGSWLLQLGLESYVQAFREDLINGDMLVVRACMCVCVCV